MPLLLVGTSDRLRALFRSGLELGSYLTGDDSVISVRLEHTILCNLNSPPAACLVARGVFSWSPALDDCLGGELITRSFCPLEDRPGRFLRD